MPAWVNVKEKDIPLDRNPDVHFPSAAGDVPLEVVWVATPLLVHLTVSPTLMVIDWGEKAKSTIETSTVAGPAVAVVNVDVKLAAIALPATSVTPVVTVTVYTVPAARLAAGVNV